jgi:guanylate kinase
LTSTKHQFGPQEQPLLIVISGPSGVGKDSVVRSLRERDLSLHFVVTVNTRAPRADETNGVDYIFISHEEFERMKTAGELLEHAQVYNDFKGVPRQQVKEAMASGKDVLMRLDVQGAATIREEEPQALLIFITTSSEEEMVQRLEARKTESAEDLKLRIETSRQEFRRIEEFDYVVVNEHGKLEEAVDTVVSIIEAEHHRVNPRKVSL